MSSGHTTQAVILAGGQGTRLRPLTLARAKPVVPLLNQPFLAWQLALLREHGVTDVILACSYRVDDVQQALGDGRALGVRLRYVVETEPLGTGGGIRNAADLTHGTVFVLNGDVLTDADLSAMRRFHESRRSRTTIFLIPVPDPRAYGLVEFDGDGRLTRFREKPTADEPITTNTINAGIYLIDAALLSRIPAGRPVSIEREFFPALISDGIPAYGWNAPASYWRDIGSPIAYRDAQMDLLDGKVRTTLRPAGELHDRASAVNGARDNTTHRIVGPAVVGDDVEIGRDARVGPRVVLGAGCRIGAGACVENAVLWEGVHVGEGARLTDCVIAAGARIGARAEIGAGVVLEAGAVVADRARLGA
ncbi:MAG: nucleotidyl transferase [Candidatus Rokuibacteriota bacterium]|nr:MAG: nucleotidyl transferase [Candidatus Rokubacteria bacterium]